VRYLFCVSLAHAPPYRSRWVHSTDIIAWDRTWDIGPQSFVTCLALRSCWITIRHFRPSPTLALCTRSGGSQFAASNPVRSSACDLHSRVTGGCTAHCAVRIVLLSIQRLTTFPFRLREVRLGQLEDREATMTRRRSSTPGRGVLLDPVQRPPLILCATIYVVAVFGGIGLLTTPASMGGGLQLVLSPRLIF